MITLEVWKNIEAESEALFGKRGFRFLIDQNVGFFYVDGTIVAILKSARDEEKDNFLHFRYTLMPATAAYIACICVKYLNFALSDHFYLDDQGKYVFGDIKTDKVDENSLTEEDRVEIRLRKSKNLMN